MRRLSNVWLLALLVACRFEHGSLARDARSDGTAIADGSPDDGAHDTSPAVVSYVTNSFGVSAGANVVTVTANANANATYVLGITTKPYVSTLTVVGLGATWTPIADQCGARSQTGVAVYVGRSATLSGPITVTLQSPPINSVALVGVYTGSASNGATARYNDVDITVCNASGTSADVDSYAFPIAATGRIVSAIATRSRTHTPGAGLVQRAQQFTGSSGDVAGIALVDGDVTSIAGTFDAATDVAAIAIELSP